VGLGEYPVSLLTFEFLYDEFVLLILAVSPAVRRPLVEILGFLLQQQEHGKESYTEAVVR